MVGRGLSPRVRGNPIQLALMGFPGGPIPACAGQPPLLEGEFPIDGAYPRVCGATPSREAHGQTRRGLSPRVRGNLLGHSRAGCSDGPIPACAGQPDQSLAGRSPGGAYPRVCGATRLKNIGHGHDHGLSPRVRGNLEQVIEVDTNFGPIPACAGQPRRRQPETYATAAYPRVCGATPLVRRVPFVGKGLSPRVRGNLQIGRSEHRAAGPIPACAGQPPPIFLNFPFWWAYPRVCGATASSVLLAAQ